MAEIPQMPEVQTPEADSDEPFDVQAARHTAFIHAIAQIALVSSCETLRVLHRRNLIDAADMEPIHETISILRDALAPAFLDGDREMFEAAVAPFPR
ncbi:MAG: hypothetical protein JWM38_407 [Sphingomonas bacterium]|jgi:hypothetical protein|nr:hypothetical protein [Sphingomonas bacterium]MDB5716980.1 hypothetical protein [Sphingomonas bacterium]